MKLILASASPRRQHLMEMAGYKFDVITADIDEEEYPNDLDFKAIPEFLAVQKARAVRKIFQGDAVIVAADTIVWANGKLYGKPVNKQDAVRILSELSGRTHQVVTGVCVLQQGKEETFHEITEVHFTKLTEDEILNYIEKHQPYDKAGAYAIQEWIGLIGISRINGCYFNVMGLPISQLYNFLKEKGAVPEY